VAGDALRRADALLADAPSASVGTHRRALARQVAAGLAGAEADQRLLGRLEIARNQSDHANPVLADATFAAAFGADGLDPDRRSPAEVGHDVAHRPAVVRQELVEALDCWAIIRVVLGDMPGRAPPSMRPLEVARGVDPDPWRNALRAALEHRDRAALIRMAQAPDLGLRPPRSLWLLGRLLIWSGQLERATETLERAWRADPGDYWITLYLALYATSIPTRPERAMTYATAAVALRPRSATAWDAVGLAHMRGKDPVAAEHAFRTAATLRPDDGLAHANLAFSLSLQGRLAEAVPEYRKEMALLGGQGRVDLGNVLVTLGRLEEGEAEIRAATKARPRQLRAWYFLALARIRLEDAAGASEALDRAAALAGPGSPWLSRIAATRVRLALLKRLPAVLRGEDRPADNAERMACVQLCTDLGRLAAAADLYAGALEAEPTLADDRTARHRESAARLAVKASTGPTRDSPPLDDAARAQLRRQALGWMRAELDTWSALLAPEAAQSVARWKTEPDLAGVRDPAALDALPADERNAWRDFWTAVDSFIARTRRD